jgi:lipopolysaccharide export system permease protein
VKLLSRYVLREHVPPFVFALGALTGLMLLNEVARRFSSLVGKGLPWSVIGEFFGLSIPFIVAMTLPMAVLVAVLYAFVRLGADNEITALRASGVNLVALVRPVVLAGLGLVVVSFLFVDHVLPPSNHKLATLMVDIARKKPTFKLQEQMVNEVIPQQYFLKAGRINQASDRLRDVVIYDFTSNQRRRTIYADSGYMAFNADRTILLLTLFNGYVHDYDRTQPGLFRRVFFNSDMIKVRGVSNQFERSAMDTWKGEREMSVCEMDESLRGQLRAIASLRRDRERALVNDVRRLLGVVPAAIDTAALRPDRPLAIARLYCLALGRLRRLLRPSAAQAQEPAAARRPGGPRPAAAPQPRPSQPTVVPGGGAAARVRRGVRYIPDTTGLQVRNELAALASRSTSARQLAARYAIEIHKKFALAAACLVFVLVGAPVALRFPRGGVGLVIGASVLIFGFYYVGLIGGETLADQLIVTPFWSMWTANLVMAAIGLLLFLRLNRQRVAARGGWRERFAGLRRRARAWRTR